MQKNKITILAFFEKDSSKICSSEKRLHKYKCYATFLVVEFWGRRNRELGTFWSNIVMKMFWKKQPFHSFSSDASYSLLLLLEMENVKSYEIVMKQFE